MVFLSRIFLKKRLKRVRKKRKKRRRKEKWRKEGKKTRDATLPGRLGVFSALSTGSEIIKLRLSE